MAETGIKQLFRKVHHLNRMYPDVLKTVKLRGKWVPIDTSQWEERNDVRTNVGLGHHSRQTLVMLITQFLQKQIEMLPIGLTDLEANLQRARQVCRGHGPGFVGSILS